MVNYHSLLWVKVQVEFELLPHRHPLDFDWILVLLTALMLGTFLVLSKPVPHHTPYTFFTFIISSSCCSPFIFFFLYFKAVCFFFLTLQLSLVSKLKSCLQKKNTRPRDFAAYLET